LLADSHSASVPRATSCSPYKSGQIKERKMAKKDEKDGKNGDAAGQTPRRSSGQGAVEVEDQGREPLDETRDRPLGGARGRPRLRWRMLRGRPRKELARRRLRVRAVSVRSASASMSGR